MGDSEQACLVLEHEEGDGWQVEGMDVVRECASICGSTVGLFLYCGCACDFS